MANIPHLLLAAGDSSRMGQSKQLLAWGDKTLIEHQIQIRLKTGQDVVVILGAHSEIILPLIKKLPITVFVNNEWTEGMGSSLAFGLKMLNKMFTKVDGVLISLLDQPLVTAAHLEKMLSSFQPEFQQIIVSQSASGWSGVPALFDKFYFEELKKLNGKDGARKIINEYLSIVVKIECGNQLEDIDTPDAYNQLLKKFFL
jgi:molybdenum cofactor cytidylyltransferase